ncbi:hypothetical protein [Paenibacillus xanthanilyticus]|uniref:Flagellar hook-length control protein-like C-terminal domain-containing protein n=1 Tax=Paenibacillus xanthanilyticus TaxID=1783531 RepID=A0ABV8KC90_9BACL
MNIGHVMRGLMGDVQQGEGKALELKAGQVVRGVVLQVMDDNEALLQINGSQVRAKLEASLAPGQSAMLQVQPPSDNGQIVMKTVDAQAAPSDETVKEWVKSLGLPETKWAGELVRDLRSSGVTLNKQVIGQFMQAAEMKPAKADMQSWMQTAAVAVKRGLPMTETTMKSLHQALSGPPVHELLQKLENGLTQFLGASKTPDGPGAASAQRAAGEVVRLLAEGSDLMQLPNEGDNAPAQGKTGVAASIGVPASATAAAQTEATVGETEDKPAGTMLSPARSEGQPDTPESLDAPPRNPLGGALGQLMKWFGVDHERLLAHAAREQVTLGETAAQASSMADETAQGTKGTEQQRAPQQGSQAVPAPSSGSGQPGPEAASPTKQAVTTQPMASSTTSTPASSTQQVGQTQAVSTAQSQQGASNVPSAQQSGSSAQSVQPQQSSSLMREGGAARQEVRSSDQAISTAVAGAAERGGSAAFTDRMSQAQGQILQGGEMTAAGPKGEPAPPAESLKHALMSLAGSDDVPPALKETAQQLIQQITGQQLLLSPERNGSPFTHVTMFIPLKTADGDQTASIHIQTRRGRKGELDADNCRLMFDLRMKSLGDTIVDVQVVDKIVSLRLWNDHPAIESLLDGSRAEITEALKQAGYQLSSLRSTPMPDRLAFASDTSSAAAPAPVQAAYASKPYKGVDYRA